jgi:cytochrome P450
MDTHPTSPDSVTRQHPPRPGVPLLRGILPRLLRDPLKAYQYIASHGDVAEYRFGGMRAFLISRPDYIAEIFQRDNTVYTRSIFHERVKPVFGDGLLTSEGESWRIQRRLIQPAFNKNRMAEFVGPITRATSQMLAGWQPYAHSGTPVDMRQAVITLTQTVLVNTVFGARISESELDDARAAVATINGALYPQLLFGWWKHLPLPGNRKCRQAIKMLEGLMHQVLRSKEAHSPDDNDLLSMLISARSPHCTDGMSALQLRDEMMTMFFAGHDTTATVLSWALYLAQEHPNVLLRLQQEVDTTLAGRLPTASDLDGLRYVRHVLEETMRLYPPAYVITRKALTDSLIGPYVIPGEALIVISPYVMHRHPDYWEKPDVFDPERFNEDRSSGRHRYAYFPFAGGPRTCIGLHLAMTEAVLILSMIVQAYRFELVPHQNIRPQARATLRPNRQLFMYVATRA